MGQNSPGAPRHNSGFFGGGMDNIGTGFSQIFHNQPGTGLGNIADPFHVDPVGRSLHNTGAKYIDPQNNGVTLNDMLADWQKNQDDMNKRLEPPKVGDAQNTALTGELGDLYRRRSGRTNFTGGTGLSESPTTASAVLLGI